MGKYKNETILQLIIQTIYLKVCIYIYDMQWHNMNVKMGQIYSLKNVYKKVK